MPSFAPLVRRILNAGSRSGGIVLVYHRVADLDRDSQCLAVSPARFASHLDAIVRYGITMSLSAMLSKARDGSLSAGAVAITFDDGYADNFTNAAPRLVQAGVPATMFLTTGPILTGREFWWDVVERCLLGPGSLPAKLRLPVGEWELSGATERSAEDSARDAGWNVTLASCPTPRHRAYVDLCARLKTVNDSVRESTIALLESLRGGSAVPRATHRPLTSDEVSDLSSLPGITIGAHTVTHPSLALLSADAQRSEIIQGRHALEQMIGKDVVSIAYPFGQQSDVSRVTVEAARSAGMTIGCATTSGRVDNDTDHLRVPRMIVRNWTSEEFIERFAAWTGATVS